MQNSKSITILGAGGGAISIQNHIIKADSFNANFIAISGDKYCLQKSLAQNKIQITSFNGLGSPQPEYYSEGAKNSSEQIVKAINCSNILFLLVCMGGANGTGIAPVVAKLAKDMGIFIVSIVTKPFLFEGQRRVEKAEAGIVELLKSSNELFVFNLNDILKNSVIKISNYNKSSDVQFDLSFENETTDNLELSNCFEKANEITHRALIILTEKYDSF